ncbi:DNA primase [Deinococcus soli (ex Cha et al. 2016)]|uniref:DNA primase n=2 Tax=Deinococcus soli (ex Cha et al. 2016) TaxID=1309411 RepID=A0ACC6KGU0_9DEIO|nr:DNA primase [Deinococcus soli (ex Cha et al. 2016)]MDR6218978.1 DNA primase [Deinococcus soli (ex Cha et al. 2016)]MDR6328775.1 DNA primase [Deinococcus soli (ex Cha et al. 2016)]MDR6751738.1 DNA primase [Deinococcus soli (ex Cha et al. 2016)]
MGTKEDVRSRLDIVDVISAHVRLTPAGKGRLKGLCPFHREKSPSFQVDTEQGYYYCFGCKSGGDVFAFTMRAENLSFGDALRTLAERAGVPIEAKYGERSSRDLYDVNAFALAFYRQHLTGAPLAYLTARGVTPDTTDAFELGYAPGEWDALLKHARTRGISERQLLDAGLLSEHPSTGRVYDRFRGRLMFPIRDALGRLVGFGGRVLGDQKPKYLNTPETDIFKKGELLYGLHKARPAVQGSGELTIVEGYLDVLLMHQHGFTNTAATLGTALSDGHAALLARQGVRSLALLFDRDEAGQRATLAGLDQVIGARFAVRALSVSGAKDPADVLAAGGAATIHAALSGGQDEVSYRVGTVLAQHDAATTAGKRAILHALLPRMQSLDPLDDVAQRMRDLVCERLDIKREAMLEWITSTARRRVLTDTQLNGMRVTGRDEHHDELELLKAVLQYPKAARSLDLTRAWRLPLMVQVLRAAQTARSADDIIRTFDGHADQQTLIRLLFEARGAALDTEEARDVAAAAAERASHEIETKLSINDLRAEIARLSKQALELDGPERTELLSQIRDLSRAVEAEKRARLARR